MLETPGPKPKYEESTSSHQKLRPIALVLFGVLLLIGSLLTVRYWVASQPTRQPRPTLVEQPVVETIAVRLGQHTITVDAFGFVFAKDTAKITPQVSGKIRQRSSNLQAGKTLNEGEMLIQLETTNYQAALASAKANLASAQSLYQQEQGKQRQATRDVKRLGVKATPLNLRKPQLAAAKAAVDNAQAQVMLAQSNLSRTTINAPFDAIVQDSSVTIGEIASPGTPIATLIATNTYVVKLTLSPSDLAWVSPGDFVTLTDPASGAVRTGIISHFDAAINQKNRTIAAYVDIDQPLSGDRPIRLAAYLQAKISGKTIANSLWVNNSAIVENRWVWQKRADNTITQVPIQVIYRGKNSSLLTFSQPIDTLITRPKDSFTEGEKVRTPEKDKENQKKSQRLNKKTNNKLSKAGQINAHSDRVAGRIYG